jgi:hypothetical protein
MVEPPEGSEMSPILSDGNSIGKSTIGATEGGTGGDAAGGFSSSDVAGKGLVVADASKDLLWKEQRRARRRRAKQERMSEKQRRYGLLLCVSSSFDVLISGFMICVAFAHAYLDAGVSLYCLGIQALSHMLCSMLLAFRFWDEYWQPEDAPAGPEDGLLKQRRRTYLVREKFMSFVMGFFMLISSVALLLKAIRKYYYWDVWHKDNLNLDQDAEFATKFLAWYGVAVYSGHAALRYAVHSLLQREVVRHGLRISLISLAYLAVLGASAALEDEWSWKAEPLAAIVLAIITTEEGARLIYTHRGDVDIRLELDPWA